MLCVGLCVLIEWLCHPRMLLFLMFGDVRLKSVGESSPPCGTSVFVFLSVDL